MHLPHQRGVGRRVSEEAPERVPAQGPPHVLQLMARVDHQIVLDRLAVLLYGLREAQDSPAGIPMALPDSSFQTSTIWLYSSQLRVSKMWAGIAFLR